MGRASQLAHPVATLDARIGDAIEWTVRRKHRRRLEANGWRRALEAGPGGWAEGDPPPRPGCQVEVLIDGVECFGAMAEAIRAARESIVMAGWFVTPGFELVRGEHAQPIGALLAAAAERIEVRVLVWAGSPIPLFQPNRRQAERTVAALRRGTRIRCELDAHERATHCHHEKTLVVDNRIAFVGGIDMTDLQNDRYDTTAHPARLRTGWHDVATRLRGPVVADVANHFALRWREVTGEQPAPAQAPPPAGDHTVQLVRTVPERQYDALPHGDFSILESYVRALRAAERLIYIENQFLWSPEITDLLADKLHEPPHEDFRIMIVLPTKAHAGQDDTLGQLGVLEEADEHDRLTVATLRALTGERDDDLYIHSKVAVIDDRWLTIGSANLNAHSLLNDSEVNIVSHDRGLALETRLRLWAEHLEVDRAELEACSATEVVDRLWRPITREQQRRRQANEPPTHRLVALKGLSRRSRRLLGPLNGLLEDA